LGGTPSTAEKGRGKGSYFNTPETEREKKILGIGEGSKMTGKFWGKGGQDFSFSFQKGGSQGERKGPSKTRGFSKGGEAGKTGLKKDFPQEDGEKHEAQGPDREETTLS